MLRTRRIPGLAAGLWLAGAVAFVAGGCGQPTGSTAQPAASSSTSAVVAPARSGAVPDANMDRAAVPDSAKWNLAPLFESDAAFEKGLGEAAANREKLAAFKGKLAEPRTLGDCLELYFQTRLLSNKLTLYASMRYDTDRKSTQLQGNHERALKAMNELIGQASFVRQEILALDEAAMKKAYDAEPRLVPHKPYVEEMRRRRNRVLGAEAERILTLAEDNLWAEIDLNEIPSDHEKSFSALLEDMPLPKVKDDKGAEVQLTLSNYGKLRSSPERRVRKDTVEALFGSLMQHQHAFAGTLAGQIRFNVFLARSRGYTTALDAYLDKDNIDPAVYRSLISSVNANLAPLHRYVAMRKRILGVDELHVYDLYTPMVKTVELKFPYGEAQKVLPEALAPLGEDYLATLKVGIDPKNGWIDVYPHKNKQSGAFSSSVFGVHPFVKMNYFEGLDDLSTLAHEYGHALHSHLSMSKQPYVTSNYPAFLAEIASTFNEKLLSDYLLSRAKTDDERLYLLNQLVDRIRTTIYRQALFAEFELALHTAAEKGTPLTAEFLNDTYGRLIRAYYGKDFTVGSNDVVEWAYIPHFYYKYYVYAYATGLSCGIALAERVRPGDAAARDAYLGMLAGGSSKPPLVLLREAGVDLTRPEAIEAAARLMDRTLGEMETILARRKP